MAQQINLLTPILLTPRRHFSALALAQSAGLVLLACVGAALWVWQRDRQADSEHQALLARLAAERQQLTAARAALPVPQDAATLHQQLRELRAGNDDRRALLQTLASDPADTAGRRHSDLLALLARSLPEAAWVSELNYAPGRVELVGGTLDTAVLRPWLGQLGAHPLLAGQQLSALRVEQLGAAAGAGKPMLAGAGTISQAGLPVWTFRVVSAPAGAASGGTR